MSDTLRHVDLSSFLIPGETTTRFTRADLPPEKDIPFALIHLANATPLRMDLDKKVFLDQVADGALAKAASMVADYIISKQPQAPILPPVALEIMVRQAAEKFGLMRRAEKIFWEYQNKLDHLKTSGSSDEEMMKDWIDGQTYVSLKVIEGEGIDIADLSPESYRYLEDSWLRDVKQIKAYYVWKSEGVNDHERNYNRASHLIRQMLISRERTPVERFHSIREYIESRYMQANDPSSFDDSIPSSKMMVARKAARIWQMTYGTDNQADDATNWFRARLYVTMFYENIVGAVIENDKQKTLNILRAFEFSKSPRNRYLIINAFEAAIAIAFLDKAIIREVLDNPGLFTFNLEPVDWWPQGVQSDRLRYNPEERELSFTGVMTIAECEQYRSSLREDWQKDAIQRLYLQSQLSPYEEMIL